MEIQKEQNIQHIERKQQLSYIFLELLKKYYGVKKGLIKESDMI